MFWNRKPESRCKADDDIANALAMLGCGMILAIGVGIFIVATIWKVWMP